MLSEILVAVGMVSVDNHRGIFKPRLFVAVRNLHDRFVVIVGVVVAVAVHRAAEYRVRKRVAARLDLPAVQFENLRALRRVYGIEHCGHRPAHGVLYPDGYVYAASDKAVKLVLARARSDGII